MKQTMMGTGLGLLLLLTTQIDVVAQSGPLVVSTEMANAIGAELINEGVGTDAATRPKAEKPSPPTVPESTPGTPSEPAEPAPKPVVSDTTV